MLGSRYIRNLEHQPRGVTIQTGIVQPDDRLVGTCGFNDWSQPHRWAELGFDLAPAQWGTGLMRRAVAAALEWAFRPERHDLIDRAHAYVRVDNTRSQGLLERSGFLREGCLRSYRVCRGRAHDFFIYGLLRGDWAAARQPA